VWNNVTEEIWIFMKEISSGGYVSTVCKLSEKASSQDDRYAQNIDSHNLNSTYTIAIASLKDHS